ncbi:MAG: hypothetical protein U0X20_13720 [Caldilineaceae bacterium]
MSTHTIVASEAKAGAQEATKEAAATALLAPVALGVFCYGVYAFVQAPYRRIFAR